jgi:hypothetical protein
MARFTWTIHDRTFSEPEKQVLRSAQNDKPFLNRFVAVALTIRASVQA